MDLRSGQSFAKPYGALIAGLIHGDEIEDVTFRFVRPRDVGDQCLSSEALACYSAEPGIRPVIVLPARKPSRVRNVLAHEYGHHVDRSYDHRDAAPDFDGTGRWWAKRSLARQLRRGTVSWGYDKGWGRSLAEIYAEDYVVLNQPEGPYDIFWLPRPNRSIQTAMRRDIERPRGLSRQRFGPTWIGRGGTRTVAIPVSESRRRVVVVTRVRNPMGKRPLRTTLTCADGRFVRSSLAGRKRVGSIRVKGAPAGPCTLTLQSGASKVLYEATVLHKR